MEAEAVEPVAEILSRIGKGGVAIEKPLSDTAEAGRVEIDPTRLVTVKSYLPEGTGLEEKIRQTEEALWHLSQIRHVEPLQVARLAEKDWAEAWKEYFFVHHIGQRLVIKPSWREYDPAPGEIVLELDPGMAFGTGLHPTTRMCANACERYVFDGMHVLDVGTGSGILAIAAAKLGARQVVAVDVDPIAVEVAEKNVVLNGVADRVEVRSGSVDRVEKGDFDLVLANIIASVIVDLAADLYCSLKPGGILIVSGIIAEREDMVRDTLMKTGLKIEETIAEGDWRALVCARDDA